MIRDITGTYCPMGCGKTLHLMESGMIQCLAGGCPRPDAVQKILASPETDDIVVFGYDSFTVLHPIRERLGELWACQVHEACTLLDGPPNGKPGSYRATFGPEGQLVLEAVTVTEVPPEPGSARHAQPG